MGLPVMSLTASKVWLTGNEKWETAHVSETESKNQGCSEGRKTWSPRGYGQILALLVTPHELTVVAIKTTR